MERNIPEKYQLMYNRRKKSRKAAIRSFCLECVGYSENEVSLCPDVGCPLYLFRLSGTGSIKSRATIMKEKGKDYFKWRAGILYRDNHKCQICGNTNNLQIHHIVPVHKDETKICENSNAITLCIRCHSEKHST